MPDKYVRSTEHYTGGTETGNSYANAYLDNTWTPGGANDRSQTAIAALAGPFKCRFGEDSGVVSTFKPVTRLQINNPGATVEAMTPPTGTARGAFHSLFGAALSCKVIFDFVNQSSLSFASFSWYFTAENSSPPFDQPTAADVTWSGLEFKNGPHMACTGQGINALVEKCRVHNFRTQTAMRFRILPGLILRGCWIGPNGDLATGSPGLGHNVYFAWRCTGALVEDNYIEHANGYGFHFNGNDDIALNHICRRNILNENPRVASPWVLASMDISNTHDSLFENNLFLVRRSIDLLSNTPQSPTFKPNLNVERNILVNNTCVFYGGSAGTNNAVKLFGPGQGSTTTWSAIDTYLFNNIFITMNAGLAIIDGGINTHMPSPGSAGENKIFTHNTTNMNTLFDNWATNDFRVKVGSAPFRSGVSSYLTKAAPTTDILGITRTGGYDAGCFHTAGVTHDRSAIVLTKKALTTQRQGVYNRSATLIKSASQTTVTVGHATIWASPTGSNASPGTFSQPVQTLEYAAQLCSQDDHVRALPGAYRGLRWTAAQAIANGIEIISDTPRAAIISGRHLSDVGTTKDAIVEFDRTGGTLDGFEINGLITAAGVTGSQRLFDVLSGGGLTLRNVLMRDNVSPVDSAIGLRVGEYSGELILEDCEFLRLGLGAQSNTATTLFGSVANTRTLTARRCKWSDCRRALVVSATAGLWHGDLRRIEVVGSNLAGLRLADGAHTWRLQSSLIHDQDAGASHGIHLQLVVLGSSFFMNDTTVYEPNATAILISDIGAVQAVGAIRYFNCLIAGITAGQVIEDLRVSGGILQSAASIAAPKTDSRWPLIFQNIAAQNYDLLGGGAPPAVDVGTPFFQGYSAAVEDFLGRPRPSGVTFDIGAYELPFTSVHQKSGAITKKSVFTTIRQGVFSRIGFVQPKKFLATTRVGNYVRTATLNAKKSFLTSSVVTGAAPTIHNLSAAIGLRKTMTVARGSTFVRSGEALIKKTMTTARAGVYARSGSITAKRIFSGTSQKVIGTPVTIQGYQTVIFQKRKT